MIELLIDTIGKEQEAFERLKDFGVQIDPDAANSFLLPDGVDKTAVGGVLESVGIEYQWMDDEEEPWTAFDDVDDDLLLLKEDEPAPEGTIEGEDKVETSEE